MNSNTSRNRRTEEEILLEFAVEPEHNAVILENYIRNYPEFSDALIALFTELSFEPEQAEEQAVYSETNVDGIWNYYKEKENSAVKVANIFAQLDKKALVNAAKKLNVSRLFFTRLRDCSIELSTIPLQLIKSLAGILDTSTNHLSDYLSSPSKVSATQNFKSDIKPKGQEKSSFEDALSNSGLNTEQQQKLKDMME
jgi:hypothetical protein